MSLIARKEGVSTEDEITTFAREFNTVLQNIADDPKTRWPRHDVAVASVLFEELTDTFPEETFCLMRGQRRSPRHGPPLEDERVWVNWVRPQLSQARIIDLAADPLVVSTPDDLWHAGTAYTAHAGFSDTAAFQQHIAESDRTALARICLLRNLFEVAIINPPHEPVLEIKEMPLSPVVHESHV
jgi:hypothetical protein